MDELTAHSTLTILAHRFGDAAARRAFGDLAGCFAPDGRWIVEAPLNLRAEGPDAISSLVSKLFKGLQVVVPTVGAVVVTSATPDRVTGRTTIAEIGQGADGSGFMALGTYQDEIVRIDDRWYFQERHMRLSAMGPGPGAFEVFLGTEPGA